MIYTVTFNPSLDYMMKLKTIKTTYINRSDEEKIYYGGKGINVSAVLKSLGCETAALGFAGGFTGRELIRLLDRDGIKNDFVFLENGSTRINVKLRAKGELDINAVGPQISKRDMECFTEKLDTVLKDGDTLVLAGALPSSLPCEAYENIMALTDGKDIKCIVDTSGQTLIKTLNKKPFLIKPNSHEIDEIFGRSFKTDKEFIEQAKLLQQLGARNVLISLAEKGSLLVCENGDIFRAEAVSGKLVNSVGCGDSMVAGFIAGFEKTQNFKEALRLAAACGSATAFTESLADKEQIKDICSKTLITQIK